MCCHYVTYCIVIYYIMCVCVCVLSLYYLLNCIVLYSILYCIVLYYIVLYYDLSFSRTIFFILLFVTLYFRLSYIQRSFTVNKLIKYSFFVLYTYLFECWQIIDKNNRNWSIMNSYILGSILVRTNKILMKFYCIFYSNSS